jgi:protein-disulfide isomerase
MSTHATSRLTLPVSERDHIRGPATALVTLVEYGDYQCPYCGLAYPVVEALRE